MVERTHACLHAREHNDAWRKADLALPGLSLHGRGCGCVLPAEPPALLVKSDLHTSALIIQCSCAHHDLLLGQSGRSACFCAGCHVLDMGLGHQVEQFLH